MTENVSVGDEVLIIRQGYGNEKSPRKYWRYGEVKEVKTDHDGVVRRVVVKTENGKLENHVVQNLVVIQKQAKNID